MTRLHDSSNTRRPLASPAYLAATPRRISDRDRNRDRNATSPSAASNSPALCTPTSSASLSDGDGSSLGAPKVAAGRDDLSTENAFNVDPIGDERDGNDSYRTSRRRSAARMASWTGQPSIRGGSEMMQMVLLTFNAIGITFTWGIEMTYCTPYLLKLGLTKSNTSLVWIAGPLSGLLVQPIVGVIADESKSRWGRRRPLMVIGSVIVAICLLILGFTREIVGWFLVANEDDDAASRPTIVLAVLSIYAVDFAINAVMSCARSLIVDVLPIEKQQLGAAWSSRMSATGHMIGYAAGAIDLVGIFGTALGDTQFKQLTIVASTAILATTAITCWAVTERVLVSSAPVSSQHQGRRFKVFRQIWFTLLHLPPRIQAICWAQFWSWIGWFPFLFYSTTWVGETYFRYDVPADAKASEDTLGDIGRIGSTSLFIYSIITFLGAFLLPFFVQSPEDAKDAAPHAPRFIASFISRFTRSKPDLLTAWIAGHLLFSASMALAPFATSFRFATLLVCLCGLPWAMAMWAPTTFLGVEVNRMSGATENTAPAYRRLSDASDVEMTSLDETDGPLHLAHGGDDNDRGTSSTGELSGIYFGILNIYATLPQFIGTFISTIVFAIVEPGKSPELSGDAPPDDKASANGPNAISVCLFIGAMSTLGAAWATRKLRYI